MGGLGSHIGTDDLEWMRRQESKACKRCGRTGDWCIKNGICQDCIKKGIEFTRITVKEIPDGYESWEQPMTRDAKGYKRPIAYNNIPITQNVYVGGLGQHPPNLTVKHDFKFETKFEKELEPFLSNFTITKVFRFHHEG